MTKTLLVFLAFSSAALAQSDVAISTLRNPVTKSYKKMVDGAQLFEARRAELAPAASLRFRLIPRNPETSLDGVALKVESDSLVIPLDIGPDKTFTLTHNRVALKEDAEVVPNRRAGTMTWRADVRTPGLPENVRRLGDLRLECEVGMKSGLISNYPAGFWGWLEELITTRGPEFCHRAKPRYLFFAERPIWSVTLVHGERREVLPVDMLYAGATRDPDWKKDRHCDCQALFDRTYFVPLGDESWPDDTLVEIETMDSVAAGEATKAAVRAEFGEATVVDFTSGYEVWVYRLPAREKPPVPAGEVVLLFEPSGILAGARER